MSDKGDRDRWLNEGRSIVKGSPTEPLQQRIEQLEAALVALRKEYDEEVISHDIKEKSLKQRAEQLEAEVEQLKAESAERWDRINYLSIELARAKKNES